MHILPKAQKNDKSYDERQEGQGIANSVQHPEAHHQLFEPQLKRKIKTNPHHSLSRSQISYNLKDTEDRIRVKASKPAGV